MSLDRRGTILSALRGVFVVAAAAAVGAVALVATLVLTALALLAGALWAAATVLWRWAGPGGKAAADSGSRARDLHLEGRRTPSGWTVEAVQR